MGFKGSSKKKKKKLSHSRGCPSKELLTDFKISPSHYPCRGDVLPFEDFESSDDELSESIMGSHSVAAVQISSIDVGVSKATAMEDGKCFSRSLCSKWGCWAYF
ncbi:hypothetical protein L1049_004330 [Liquidambar formosana]|uniref:Uncharacterized protein n=1 Tax=Liquidambar formosana TaxID=63359 RepID=A0AAP0RPB1_LIQFO